MFTWAARQLLEHEEMEWGLRNAVVENLLLHARVLYEFLGKKKYPDDISAGDFLDNPHAWKRRKCSYLDANMWRINAWLVHLSQKREEKLLSENEHWKCGEIVREITLAFTEFIDALPDAKREWFSWFKPHA